METKDENKTDPCAGDLQEGPFEDTTTKTIEVQPIKITVTTSRKSTHVPAPEAPCGCNGGGLPSIADLMSQVGPAVAGAAAAAGAGPSVSIGDVKFSGEGNPNS